MNYRQWKKNYKKMHGCNPPFEVDKRKEVKTLKKSLKYISEMDWSVICEGIAKGLRKVAEIASKLAEDYREVLEVDRNDY